MEVYGHILYRFSYIGKKKKKEILAFRNENKANEHNVRQIHLASYLTNVCLYFYKYKFSDSDRTER